MTATLNGIRATSVRLHVPYGGLWVADVALDTATPPTSGAAELVFGGSSLRGYVEPSASGVYHETSRVRVLGGAGGWRQSVGARHYHNDAGVRRSLVASDLAREVGETLAEPADTSFVGIDYPRRATRAADELDQLYGAAWWVDLAGVTNVGPRPTADAGAGVEVLNVDPLTGVALLALEGLAALGPGSVLRGRLPAPLTVRELLVTSDRGLRAEAWCRPLSDGKNRIQRAVSSMARAAFPNLAFFVPYRYRVVRQSVDRLELQAVRKVPGLPDMLPLSLWPGVPGVSTEPALGAEVLVQFVEGDRAQPVVTHFAGKGGAGFVPAKLAIDADDITLGHGNVEDIDGLGRVVRYGDPILFESPGQGTILPGTLLTHFSRVKA